jgi:hypothetical protein
MPERDIRQHIALGPAAPRNVTDFMPSRRRCRDRECNCDLQPSPPNLDFAKVAARLDEQLPSGICQFTLRPTRIREHQQERDSGVE